MKIDKYFHLYSRKDDVVFEEIHAPVRKPGKWIHYENESDRYDDVCCSECRKNFTVDAERFCDIGFTVPDLKFCPNCGADMRGDHDG